ncbi:MAG: hypothetical protein HY902_19725 [Deltaproteobacteria bacterium]|nr:hypothetical protein [Deltaproteobacteria bacterium]
MPVFPNRLVAAAALAFSLGACSSVQHLELRDTPMYTLADLRAKPDEAVKRAMTLTQPIAVHFKKGDELALNLGLDVPGLTLVASPTPATVRLDRDLYGYFDGKRLWLSPDGDQWAKIDDHKGLRKLFGLGRGTFQMGAGVTAAEGAVLSVKVGMR